jgi:alpha-glucosidase (family GH31 glycosyl hydrolase)
MKMKLGRVQKISLILLSVFLVAGTLMSALVGPAKAYVSALGDVIGTSVSGDKLTLTVDNGTEPNDDILVIELLEEDIARFNYRPNGVTPSADTPMLDPNKTWGSVGATIDTSSNPITVTTTKMIIEITKQPARVTIKKSDGTTILWEPSTGGVHYDGIRFLHNTNDNVYGIRSFDAFEDKGDILRNNNSHAAHAGQQGDSGGPFMWSTAGYGVLVDSDGGYPYTEEASGKLEFYYGGTPPEGRRYSKTDVEYFVMLGEPEKIMDSYSDITGKAPIMPKWSLGFMNFEWDNNQIEMFNMIDEYRAKDIPIDAYGLDYDWKKYGEDNYGSFAWNTNNFPDASTTSLKTQMDGKGVKMIGITKPRIVTKDFDGNRTVQYYDAENGGYWYPGHEEYQDYFIPVTVRSIDPYKANQRSWNWNHSTDAYDKGIVGWWNDETDKVSSGSTEYWFGNFTTGHMSQGIYEGQRAYTNDTARVWQTARTFYPGAQRYATTLWSGDIGIQFYKGEKISWAAGMQEQPPVMLSAVNLGQPKWGMDAGGFNKADGTTYNPRPELYTRWLQFAAFTPVFRVHGNNHQQRQPWFYGNTAEEVSKAAIKLRYSLLPYMYAYERQTYETNVGLIKPLMFDYPNDPDVENKTDSWMFGDWMLVSPVLVKDQNSKDIYLPSGEWIDYFRGNTYQGGQTIHYAVNANTWTDIPVFVKKGAIIPSQQPQDYVGQNTVGTVNVDVFPDTSQTSFTYYDDDGQTYDYESGEYFKQELTTQDTGTDIIFTAKAKTGSYTPDVQYYLVKVHGEAGTSVAINGSSATSYTDLNALKATSGEGWTTGRDIYGEVTYVKLAAVNTSDRTITVSGDGSVSAMVVKYEAEEASLSGKTVSTQPAVDTDHTGYSGSGFVDNMVNDGVAVTFYTDVKSAGDYNVSLRYANATGSDKSISIFVNGERVKRTTLANLANWDTWGTQTEKLPLEAGRNIITYEYLADAGDTGNVNLDYMEVPFDPVQSKYEAESADLAGGASTNGNHWYYSGKAFVDSITAIGAETTFNVDVPTAGNYDVALRYANGTQSTQTLSTYVNGSKVRQISLISPSGNWNEWQEHVQSLSLNAGRNTISFKYDSTDSGTVNLDRVTISSSTPVIPISEVNLLDNGGFDRDTAESHNWTEWHPSGQEIAYGIDGGLGTNPPEAAWTGNQRAWFWASGAYQQSIHQVISVPVNNANYKMEARVRLKNTTPYTARAEITNYGGSDIYYSISNDGVWKYISIDNIYVTNGQIDVGFYVDSPGGTTLHIDDVRISKQ